MRYSKELLKGGTPLLVMSVLDGKDLYGYRIISGVGGSAAKMCSK